MFHLSHPPPPPHLLHVTSATDGSLLKCYHPRGYIQLSTGRLSYEQQGFRYARFQVRSEEHPYR